jgi:hypothetical protein
MKQIFNFMAKKRKYFSSARFLNSIKTFLLHCGGFASRREVEDLEGYTPLTAILVARGSLNEDGTVAVCGNHF